MDIAAPGALVACRAINGSITSTELRRIVRVPCMIWYMYTDVRYDKRTADFQRLYIVVLRIDTFDSFT